MATIIEKGDRHVIPRWVPSSGRINSAEFSPVRIIQRDWDPDLGELEKRKREWEKNPSIPFAADLVGVALVLGKSEVARPAALAILREESAAPASVRELAERVVAEPDYEALSIRGQDSTVAEMRLRTHTLRERLRRGPHNPLLWADLALAFSALGQTDKAGRCLQIANSLAPDERFILRATTRFHVHQDRPDAALELLRRSPLVKTDPWILSAEIAVSDIVKKGSPGIRRARLMLNDNNFSAAHISELASALGTLELKSGARRKARQLLERSLEKPTENAVAQATWIVNEIDKLVLPERVFDVPNTFEARALYHYYDHKWNDAVICALEWQHDEPFSARPATLGSHLAAVALEDYDLSARIARQGLTANPKDFALTNNLAFALASDGRGREASQLFDNLDRRDLSERHHIFYFATSGLIRYRLGEPEVGKVLYKQAIERALSARFERERAMALLFLAREEARINSAEASSLLAEAERAWTELKDDELKSVSLLLQRLKAGQV